jgi:flagellar hook-length control protein FliK
MASSLQEDAHLPLAPPEENKSLSLTEKAEPTEDAKTAIHLATAMMGQAIAIPVTDASTPHADPSPTENATRQLASPCEPDATLFAQTVKPQDAARLARETDEPSTGKAILQETAALTPLASHEVPSLSDRHADRPSPLEKAERLTEPAFMQQAAETLKRENDGPATDAAPAKNPETTATAVPATPASQEVPALSDRHAGHPSPHEEAERRTEPAFIKQAAETLKRENDGPATDAAPAKNPGTVAAAVPATPASHEVPALSDRHAGHPSPPEEAERRTEPAFVKQAAETLKRENDGPATDAALSDIPQARPSHHDQGKRAGGSKEGAWIAAASQKPNSAVGDRDAKIGQTMPEHITPGELPDKVLSIREAVTETPGLVHDHQQNRNTTPNHQRRSPECDLFPFRMEMPNVVSPQATHTPATVGSTGIETQAVIDQILEARQGVSNDFGRIRILLNPPNLGTVDLDIVVRREKVEVVMTAENATVQQALQSRVDDIRVALQRQDLKIEGFQVLLQDNGTSQQQTRSGVMYQQSREQRERFNANKDTLPAVPLFSSISGVKSAAGLVSIFV